MVKNTKKLIQQHPARGELIDIIDHTLAAVGPADLVAHALLKRNLSFGRWRHLYVIGFGKASYGMAQGIEHILGTRITKGLINVPRLPRKSTLKRIALQRACHPIPCNQGIIHSQKIVQLVKKAGNQDLVICLISGGASSLFEIPAESITIADLKKTYTLLIKNSSATIKEINIIRKHLSQVKGGQLLQAISPATSLTLIISDVIGDNPTTIASGPTVPDTSTFKQAWRIVEKYKLVDSTPSRVKKHLRAGIAGAVPETPDKRDPIFKKSRHSTIIVGSNKTALNAARMHARALKLSPVVLPQFLQGDVKRAAKEIAVLLRKLPPQSCLIAGGETTVQITGPGWGGRNQELALYLLKLLPKRLLAHSIIATIATDGIDGFCPQTIAGAIVDRQTDILARRKKMNIKKYLTNNDSYRFWKRINSQLITGATGTNVGDILIAIKK